MSHIQTTVAESARVAAIHSNQAHGTKQGLPYFFGISQNTTDATGLAMHRVEIPPGGRAAPHLHHGFETAIYLLAGRVETRYGAGLRQSVINEAGSFLFIPPGVPHQPINLSATETAIAVVARNDPREQENAVLYDPASHAVGANECGSTRPLLERS